METPVPLELRCLRKSRLRQLLDRLDTPEVGVTWTAYVPPFKGLAGLGGDYERVPWPPEVDELSVPIRESETGAAVFWGPDGGAVVLPPFPLSLTRSTPGVDTAPLRALLDSDLMLGVVLVRLGGYSIGVF